MIFCDGHDGIDLASENIVPVVHCCSCSYSWSLCHLFPLLVLPTATRLRLMQKNTLSLHSDLHSIWIWKCHCPHGLLGNYSERLSSSRKGRRLENYSVLAWNEFPRSLSSLKFCVCNFYTLKECRLLLENVNTSSEKSLCEVLYLAQPCRNSFSKIPFGRKIFTCPSTFWESDLLKWVQYCIF